MKNVTSNNRKVVILSWIMYIALSLACSESKQDECLLEGCDPGRNTIKTAYDVEGKITLLSGHSDIWVIVSEEGIIGEKSQIFDGPDVVIFCNISDSLKVIDERIVFSGELKNSCDDFEIGLSQIYYGYLTKLSLNADEK